MRAPPPVRVSVGGDRRWRQAVGILAALAAANLAAWTAERVDAGGVVIAAAAAAAAVVGGVIGAVIARRREVLGELAWDGSAWQWARAGGPAQPGQAEVSLDLDSWMLLRFRAESNATRWLPLSRRDHPSDWSSLRAALYWLRPQAPDDPR